MTSTKPPSQDAVSAVNARVSATGQVTDADLYVLAASTMALVEALLPIHAMATDPPAYQLARTVLWTVPRRLPSSTHSAPPDRPDVHRVALEEIDRVVGNEIRLGPDQCARLRGILSAALSERRNPGG